MRRLPERRVGGGGGDIRERHDKMPLLPKERGWRDTESQNAPFGEREREWAGEWGGVGSGWVGGQEVENKRHDKMPLLQEEIRIRIRMIYI